MPVDLLPRALAHVPDVHVAVGRIEAEAPRVAKPVRPDLGRTRPWANATRSERVVSRDGVRLPRRGLVVHVDAQHLAQQRPCVLPVPEGVAAGAAISHADVQEAIRPERELAAIVVRKRLRDQQQHALAGGIRPLGGGVELTDHRCAIGCARVVHEDARLLWEIRMEGEAQQPALASGEDPVADVEERLGAHRTVGPDDANQSALQVDEEPPAAVARVGDEEMVIGVQCNPHRDVRIIDERRVDSSASGCVELAHSRRAGSGHE